MKAKRLSKKKAEAIYKAMGLDPSGKCFCGICQRPRFRELWNSMRRGLMVISIMKRD